MDELVRNIDRINHCSKVAEEKCEGLEILLKGEIDEYSDIVQLADATYEALIWYYYCYSVGEVLSCLDEEFSDNTKAIVIKYFESLSNYVDFLKENFNL